MVKARKLHIVCLAASKGGVGKSTLTTALAVRAAQDGHRVCLIDADAQLSLTRWHELRKAKESITLASVDATPEGVGLLAADYDWVFVDTPPAIIDVIENAISTADAVLIPSRASAVDVLAMDDVAYLCEKQGKPFAFVLNAVVAQWGNISDAAAGYLRKIGPVLETRVAMRKPYVSAMTTGRSGAELDRAAAREIDALWLEVQAFVAGAAKKGRARVR